MAAQAQKGEKMQKRKRMIRPKEASFRMGISRRTLHDYITQGKLRYYRLSPRCIVFDEADIDAFLESRRVG
jgi:excisionase family DNA binding protein